MAVRGYKPNTPARRGMTTADKSEVTRKRPIKSLTKTKVTHGGRGSEGKITSRRRGGGAKQRYRIVDFGLEAGTEAVVESIEYDPNRSSHVALIKKTDGEYAYILAGSQMKEGDRVQSGEEASIKKGNRLPLSAIPMGSTIHSIETTRGKGGQLVRSAGAGAQLTSKEGDWAHVRLPSGEVRLIHLKCYATLGNVGNVQHQNVKVGSAGRSRRMGKRPSVRGKAMNPVDHVHGGGEGQTMGRIPRTPWGKTAIGKKTRHRKRGSEAIIRHRSKKKRK